MRFILLVPFVIASPVFRRDKSGLLDGVLSGRSVNGQLGGLLGGSNKNNGLLGSGNILGTGIGTSNGVLGTGLLGNKGWGSKDRGHRERSGRHHYQDFDNYDYVYDFEDNNYYTDNGFYSPSINNYGY